VALLVALSLVFVAPIFRNVHNLGALDWDANLYMHAVPRITILEYAQIPLWNPYEWGGIPMLGSPWSRFLSPSFTVILAFGTVLGSKIDVWVHLVIGLLGTYLLCRERSMGRAAAFTAASAYLFGGWFALTVASGMAVFLGTAFFPWVFLARRRAEADPRFSVALGALGALMLFDGATEPLAMLVVALAFHEAVDLVTRRIRPRRTVAVAIVSLTTFVGLSAIKLLPMLELLSHRQRSPRLVGGYSIDSLWRALLERGQTLRTEFPPGDGFWRGVSWGIDETGAYVGALVLALAAWGVASRWRDHPTLPASLVFFVWTAFGERMPVGPWKLLHALPPFSLARVPERFRFVFLLDLALLAGIGLDALREGLARSNRIPESWSRHASTAAAGLAAIVALDLVSANRIALDEAFPVPAVEYPQSERFVQVLRLPHYDERGFLGATETPSPLAPSSSLYPAVVAGIGSARGFEPLTPRTRLRVRVTGNADYRGEQWLEGTQGSVTLVRWTPNALTFDVAAEHAGTLIVNQAFDRGWRSKDGPSPGDENGLLAAAVRPGTTRVELFYRPATFVAGAILSGLSLLSLAGWLVGRRFGLGRHLRSARVSTD
jgi:hypothetical protein